MKKETKKEKVIMKTTVKNPKKKPEVVKLNEAHATMDIAKNLIQDYTFLLTMSVVKTIFRQINNPEVVLKDIYTVWSNRASAQLAEETKNYQKAITDAFQGSEASITEEVANQIKEYMDTYCRVRDNAVKMANDGITEINRVIVPQVNQPTQEATAETTPTENETTSSEETPTPTEETAPAEKEEK